MQRSPCPYHRSCPTSLSMIWRIICVVSKARACDVSDLSVDREYLPVDSQHKRMVDPQVLCENQSASALDVHRSQIFLDTVPRWLCKAQFGRTLTISVSHCV
ncbi:hypothetical protein A0H81_11963 [Grifola frondosa]|uniref:Uncharacterized protein n=1 Tax=Grifola frondosa TaxID=5627 RepID=A0A1C7LTT5_GRIFR|nr:hypothetical protein A0H81_11963 [Grifola frondosa]